MLNRMNLIWGVYLIITMKKMFFFRLYSLLCFPKISDKYTTHVQCYLRSSSSFG